MRLSQYPARVQRPALARPAGGVARASRGGALSDASASASVGQQWLAKLPRRSPYTDPQDRTRLNLTVFRDYQELGLVQSAYDEKLNLFVWNYTDEVGKFDLWDEVTCTARNLVVDISGEVVGRSFSKFHDKTSKFAHKPADATSFTVQEKLDGSLGQLFHHRGQWHAASRSSFADKQEQLPDHLSWRWPGPDAIRSSFADNQLKLAGQLLASDYSTDPLDPSLTYVYEFIHPDHHGLVHNADRKALVLLAAFRRDGSEVFPLPAASLAASGFPLVQTYIGKQFSSLDALSEISWGNAKGFVVRFSDRGRWTVKLRSYMLAHRAASHPIVETLFAAFQSGCVVQQVAASNVLPWVGYPRNSVVGWVKGPWKEFEDELARRSATLHEAHAHLLAASQGSRAQYAEAAQGREDSTALMLMYDGREEAAREAVLQAMQQLYSQQERYSRRVEEGMKIFE